MLNTKLSLSLIIVMNKREQSDWETIEVIDVPVCGLWSVLCV